jgi:hypothetical protein
MSAPSTSSIADSVPLYRRDPRDFTTGCLASATWPRARRVLNCYCSDRHRIQSGQRYAKLTAGIPVAVCESCFRVAVGVES